MLNLLKVYKFLAEKNNWIINLTEHELMQQIMEECAKKDIFKASSIINIDDYSVISSIYVWGHDEKGDPKAMVKIANDNITEYYIRPIKKFRRLNAEWMSVDIHSNEPIEYYVYEYMKEKKYDVNGNLMQINYGITKFEELPDDFKLALENYPEKNKVFNYSRKPYAKVVEINH